MIQQEPPKIPESWRWVTLSEVVDFLDGKRIPINQEERSKRIAGKPKEELYPYYGANGQVGWIDNYIFEEKLVLLAEDGGFFDEPGRPVAYIVDGKYWVNNHAHVMRPRSSILHEFLMYVLNTFSLMPYVRGTTRYKLNQGSAKSIGLPLPPLQEQRLIIARVESILKRTRAAKQELSRIPKLTKRLRIGLLSKAYHGRLIAIEGGNQSHAISRTEGRRQLGRSDDNGEITNTSLPPGWKTVRLADIIESMSNGVYTPSSFYGSGVACLRMYNIQDGEISLHELKRMRLTDEEYQKYKLLPGDILLNRVNTRELVGKAAVVPSGVEPLVFESKNIRIRVRAGIDSRYVSRYLQTREARAMIEQSVKQTVGMATISQKDIKKWIIPLPDRETQQEIADLIEALFAQIKQTQNKADKAMTSLGLLEQSTLNMAFIGKMVSDSSMSSDFHDGTSRSGPRFSSSRNGQARISDFWEEQGN